MSDDRRPDAVDDAFSLLRLGRPTLAERLVTGGPIGTAPGPVHPEHPELGTVVDSPPWSDPASTPLADLARQAEPAPFAELGLLVDARAAGFLSSFVGHQGGTPVDLGPWFGAYRRADSHAVVNPQDRTVVHLADRRRTNRAGDYARDHTAPALTGMLDRALEPYEPPRSAAVFGATANDAQQRARALELADRLRAGFDRLLRAQRHALDQLLTPHVDHPADVEVRPARGLMGADSDITVVQCHRCSTEGQVATAIVFEP